VRKRDGNRDVIVVKSEGASSIWWLFVGGALGAGLALLFAPGSGAETRRKISARVSKIRDSAEEVLDGLRDRLDPDERVHRSLTEADGDEDPEAEEDAAPRRPAAAGGRAPSAARQELEQRLAEARARRQRALAEEDEEPVA
jgi:hypothetical protein